MSRDRFDCMRGWLVGVLPSAYREGAMPWVFFIGIAVGVLMLGLAVVEYQTFGDLASLLFAVSIFVLLFAVQRGLSFRRAVLWAMGAGLCAQWLASWSSGGIYSPRLAWLVLLPLTPFFFFGLRAGVRWLSVVALTLLGLALSTQFGWLAVPATSDAVSMASAWASFALVTVWECLNFCVRSTERLVHGGGRRFATNDRRGGQVGATSYVAAFVKRSS